VIIVCCIMSCCLCHLICWLSKLLVVQVVGCLSCWLLSCWLSKLLVVYVVGCPSCWLSKLLVVEFMHIKLRAYALELMVIKVEGLCPGAHAH